MQKSYIEKYIFLIEIYTQNQPLVQKLQIIAIFMLPFFFEIFCFYHLIFKISQIILRHNFSKKSAENRVKLYWKMNPNMTLQTIPK